MPRAKDPEEVAKALHTSVASSSAGSRRMKIRSLLAKFGFSKRSDSNTAAITEALGEVGIVINPPLVRLGDEWELGVDDWVYLSTAPSDVTPDVPSGAPSGPSAWNEDGWFDRIGGLALRTEKEVEIKFVVPLLKKLGYGDDDRYDGMPVPAARGSRGTTLVIDFALFNHEETALRGQPLLTVEAKKEDRLIKQKELGKAINQAKSYCVWTQCDYFMVTDSKRVDVYHIRPGFLERMTPLFSCERHELHRRFSELHAIASKEALTKRYLSRLSSTEEAR